MTDPDGEVLRRLRAAEIESVYRWFPPGSRVLEIGGGDGFQASLLEGRGHRVSSIDVAERPRPRRQFHAVEDYDGVRLPFVDASFDVVFSSNVLEHMRQLPAVLAEVRRVLKGSGLAIHLVPSASWRLWTTLAHYPWLATRALDASRARAAGAPALSGALARNSALQFTSKLLGLGQPPSGGRHGGPN